MDYVLIKNGKIVVDGTLVSKDLLIGNNKIISVEESIKRPEPETPVIDAGGKYVIPGAIDANIAFTDLFNEGSEVIKRLNQAQTMCGTTTVLQPLHPKLSFNVYEELLHKRKESYKINADYGFHLSLNGWEMINHSILQYIYAHEGISTFYLTWPIKGIESVDIEQCFTLAAEKDMTILVDLKADSEDISDAGMYFVNHESILKHLFNLRQVIELAIKNSCQICILNVCFWEELELIQSYDSQLIYTELYLPYHIANSDKVASYQERIFSGIQVDKKLKLISEADFWTSLLKDNFILSRPLLNLSGQGVMKDSQVDNRPDEFIHLKNFLSVLFTAGVKQGHLSMQDFVEITSTRIAKLMGIYPKKGTLKVGADADILIWNPDYKRSLYCYFPNTIDWNMQQFALEGRVEFLFSKGRMVYNGENFNTETIFGSYIYRSPLG